MLRIVKHMTHNETNQIYEKNLESLRSNYELLYNLFLTAINDKTLTDEFNSNYEIEGKEGKRGYPTFVLKRKSDGAAITGHSIFDPVKEAEKKISKYSFQENTRIVQIGFGFGYETRAILEKYKHPILVVIEPFPLLFKKALETIDFTDMFKKRKVLITFEVDPKSLKYALTNNCSYLNIPKYDVIKLQYSDFFPDIINIISKSIKEIQVYLNLNFNTAIAASAVFQRNIMINATQTLRNPGITSVFDKFKNRPVFIVAPGPSLEKNGHLLKKVMGKELIIACDTAVQPLQRMGVKPDIITTIDFQILNFYKLRGVNTSNSALAISLDASYFIPADNPGQTFNFFHSKEINAIFEYFHGSIGIMSSGGSVLTDCISIAHKAGANPLVFVGVDLSFPGDKYYIEGTFDDGATTEKVKNKGFNFIEIEDIYGEKVLTYESFYNFLTWIGAFIKINNSIKFIDATEGGAKIVGTEIIPLQEVIDKYVIDGNESPKSIIDDIFINHVPTSLQKMTDESSEFAKSFKNMEKQAKKGAKLSERALTTVETSSNLQGNSKFVAQLTQINRIRNYFQSNEAASAMVFINPLIDKYVAAVNYFNDDKTLPQRERYTKMLEIEKATFEGMQKSCNAMASHFERIEAELLVQKGEDYV